MKNCGMLINGESVMTKATAPVLSPATEEILATVPIAGEPEIAAALNAAKEAQRDWGRRTGVERGDILRKWADLIDRNRDRLARASPAACC